MMKNTTTVNAIDMTTFSVNPVDVIQRKKNPRPLGSPFVLGVKGSPKQLLFDTSRATVLVASREAKGGVFSGSTNRETRKAFFETPTIHGVFYRWDNSNKVIEMRGRNLQLSAKYGKANAATILPPFKAYLTGYPSGYSALSWANRHALGSEVIEKERGGVSNSIQQLIKKLAKQQSALDRYNLFDGYSLDTLRSIMQTYLPHYGDATTYLRSLVTTKDRAITELLSGYFFRDPSFDTGLMAALREDLFVSTQHKSKTKIKNHIKRMGLPLVKRLAYSYLNRQDGSKEDLALAIAETILSTNKIKKGD